MSRLSKHRSTEIVEWLHTNPSLDDLIEVYPAEWVVVQRDLGAVIERDDAGEIQQYVAGISRPETALAGRNRSRRERLNAEIRRQMTIHLLKQAILSASTGVEQGRIRFNLVAGFVAQRLLFRRGLERKPVATGRFRLLWPLLGKQRRLLMPLVQPQGIWCFYSRELITGLAPLIGDRSCVEIAAGDGTLSRFLAARGVRVTATDDHSWNDSIDFPDSVAPMDARMALRTFRPQVVLCCWPPAGNTFERQVFATPSVQRYIVIGSRHESTTGDRAAYRAQASFDQTERSDLSLLVFPPEIDPAVYVFDRTTPRA